MNTDAIIEQIDAEISRLQQAKVLLTIAISPVGKRGRGRPKTNILSVSPAKPVKRGMSTAGKARVAAAQKRRWALVKKAAKKSSKAVGVKTVVKILKPVPAKAVKKAVPATKAIL